MYSFYEDLKTDAANFTKIIREYEIKELAFNNARSCFDQLQIRQGDSCMADLVRNAETFPDLVNVFLRSIPLNTGLKRPGKTIYSLTCA